jgi:hypothetical protein
MFEAIRKALFPTPAEIMEKLNQYERLAGERYCSAVLTETEFVKRNGTPTRLFLGTRNDN